MKEIKIENIALSLSSEDGNVRVKSDKENIILFNQNIDPVTELIEHNFIIVTSHYKFMIEKRKSEFDDKDINVVGISIVLYYLYMYNSWRTMYKKQENKDLRFKETDFNHPSTHDIIFRYFRIKYPNDWDEKCAILFGMELSELQAYYKTREKFYNK